MTAIARTQDVSSASVNALLVPTRSGTRRLRLADIVTWPMPDQPSWRARLAIRIVAAFGRRQVKAICGLDHVAPSADPFILALSHNVRRESMFVPALLMLLRGGRHIHFLADWNFLLIPGIGWLMRHGGTIAVTRKSAGVFNVFRPLFRNERTSAEQARAYLRTGCSIGVFPEGTVSHDPVRMLPGRVGAARMSLETGVPIVPAGIRFPDAPQDRRLSEFEPLEVHIGAALRPPATTDKPSLAASRAWHAEIMQEIARLSGKCWAPRAPWPTPQDHH